MITTVKTREATYMNIFKITLKKIINYLGFEVHRLNVNSVPAYQLLKSLMKFKIDIILDVGANDGQFASEIRSVGYKGSKSNASSNTG